MDNLIQIDEIKVNVKREAVFDWLDIKSDNEMYEEMCEEYTEVHDLVADCIKPRAILSFCKVEPEDVENGMPFEAGTEVLYYLTTVGEAVVKLSQKYFAEGDYLKGMLADTMADCYLFAMDEVLQSNVKEACHMRNVGVAKRMEAPKDYPMEMQMVIYNHTEAKERLGLGISSGYMFDPVKSNGQIMLLTKDAAQMNSEHDCANCDSLACKARTVKKIEICVEGEKTFSCLPDQNLLEILQKNGVYISAPCGGNGKCGKCKVTVKAGKLEPSKKDRELLEEDEIENGIRLACAAYPKMNLTLALESSSEDDFDIITEFTNDGTTDASVAKDGTYAVAIDIGTTTIAASLLDTKNKKIVSTTTTINRQRAFGADVISRIQASNEGKKDALQQSIVKDLNSCILQLQKDFGIEASAIRHIAIGANTTMGHLLMGYSCETLGVFPFTPVNIKKIDVPAQSLLGAEAPDCTMTILPGISTYVGGDIISGLFAHEVCESEELCLLVDLGTNGEIALGNKDKILVTSTAAGPAFEGGNISTGIGGIKGAVCGIKINGTEPQISTIGDVAPIGICGTGVVEITAELVKNEIVDETGLFDEDYEDGYTYATTESGDELVFSQKDVREIQLAKSAIRAGIETLICRYGIERSQIDKVYLAGGFGKKLDKDKAVEIGMFAPELSEKIVAVGNSSLNGAVSYLLEEDAAEKMEHIVNVSTEIDLASDKDFNEFYMEYMYFECE